MPSLTSCYFCGDAVTASLDEYDLPPDAVATEQVTVTLCATCKTKLDELLASIGDAGESTPPEPVAGDPEPVFAADDDPEEGTDEGSEVPADAAGDGGVAPADAPQEAAFERDDGDEVEEDVDHGAADEQPEPAGTEPAPEVQGGASAQSGGAGEPEQVDADAPAEPDLDPGIDGGISFDEQPADSAGSGQTSAGERAESAADEPATVTPEADAGSAPEPAGESRRSADAASSGGETGPFAGVSTRTYNRVVRLLQNREFPVDRAQFEVLASNAYELEEGDVGAALDATIEKGLLDERDGMLHRPE